MDADELRELCTLTAELTRLRQNECKHLCIENFAPELLGKLIRERLAMGLAAPDEALRLPRWLVEWIDQQDGTRADVIEAALLKAHKLRAPKD